MDADIEEYLKKHLREKKIDVSIISSTEKGILHGDTERKQVVPVRRGNTQGKCFNITDKSKKSICTMAKNKESLLTKVNKLDVLIRLMTGEQMRILNNDSFNQEVECLKRRVGQVEWTKTHEEIVKTSLQKVSDLVKEVNAIQEETSSTAAVPQVGCR